VSSYTTKDAHSRTIYTEMKHPTNTPSDDYVWICTYCAKTFDSFPFDTECSAHVVTWAKSQLARKGDKILGLKIPKNTQFGREENG
jgi:heterodisulfide reductase subunit C